MKESRQTKCMQQDNSARVMSNYVSNNMNGTTEYGF